MKFSNFKFIFLFAFIFINVSNLHAQGDEQKKLEEKRKQLQDEIAKIKTYIESSSKKEKTLSTKVEELSQQIVVRESLIKKLDVQLAEVGSEIDKNNLLIKRNEEELNKLKKEYADMLYKSYKNKNSNSQLLFLMSSESFQQGYKRFQYLKQYASYRKKQGEAIAQKNKDLQALNQSLMYKKNHQEIVMQNKTKEQTDLQTQKNKQQELVKQYQKQKKDYQAQVTKKQSEEKKLNQQIESLIKAEIQKSIAKSKEAEKKKTNNSTTTSANKETTVKNTPKVTPAKVEKNEFVLAPEAKELAGQFASNKGKLPWPVEKGVVTVRFGKQPDPMDPKLIIESNGVRINTADNQSVRSVFDGTVLAIQKNPQNGILSVLVQHGNYITVYANLKSVSVSKGAKVKTKQSIGVVNTDVSTGKAVLKFQIWNNDQQMDPSLWIGGL